MANADPENGKSLAKAASRVLNFFRKKCIKLEDESHITSDSLQQSIKTFGPLQVIPHDQQALIMRFYDFLMGHEPSSEALAKKAGLVDKSKHFVPLYIIKEIQDELAERLSAEMTVDNINAADIGAYLTAESRKKPQWLKDLRQATPEKAELIVLARTYIQTVLPYILTMQLKKDYGYSIHEDDLTAAPKHDEVDVASHFGDRVVLMALTIQLYQQEGVPKEYVKKIIQNFKKQHDKERLWISQGDTDAELMLRKCLPKEYHALSLDGLSTKRIDEICQNNNVCHYQPMIQYFLYQYALPQIRSPKYRAISTAADLHGGFEKSILFSATPGLIESYPATLSKDHCYLATDFEAEVISKLLQKENLQVIQIDMTHTPDAFFTNLKQENLEAFNLLGTLIDRGALLSGSKPQQVVDAYLSHIPENIRVATAHFLEEQLILCSKDSNIAKIKIDGTELLKSLERQGVDPTQYLLLLYLDLCKTTGVDVKRPYKDVAGLTLGKEQTMAETIQAAMRERDLLSRDAQTVVWILFKSLYQTIVPASDTFDLKQVFYWMIRNEAKKDQHKIMARAYQGIEHEIESVIWQKIDNGEDYEIYAKGLERSIEFSIYDHYELESTFEDTDIVLQKYITDFCIKFSLKPEQLPKTVQQRLKNIVADTKRLIAQTHLPQSADVHVEVMQEQRQEQQTNTEIKHRFSRD